MFKGAIRSSHKAGFIGIMGVIGFALGAMTSGPETVRAECRDKICDFERNQCEDWTEPGSRYNCVWNGANCAIQMCDE